jgi:hypothetical protein
MQPSAQFLSNTREPNSLSGNAVYSIWVDKQSRKWIGTLRGDINVIDPNKERFQNIVSQSCHNQYAHQQSSIRNTGILRRMRMSWH